MKAWSSNFSATPIPLMYCRLYGEVRCVPAYFCSLLLVLFFGFVAAVLGVVGVVGQYYGKIG